MSTLMRNILAIAAILALAAPAARAEQRMPAGPPPREENPGQEHGGPGAEQREEARKKIEVIRIARLTEALSLDEKTAAKFIPAITTLEMRRKAAMMEHRMMMMELRRQLRADPADAAKLKETIDRFISSQRDMQKLHEKEIETARDHLTTEQVARYLLFQQDFMREVQDIISGMRGGMGMGPGVRGGRGPGMNRQVPGGPPEP